MKRDDLTEIRRFKLRAQDVLVFVMKDEAPDPSAHHVHEILNEFEEDSDVTVLLFREGVFSDLVRLDLKALIELQERVEQAIAQISTRDSKGEA